MAIGASRFTSAWAFKKKGGGNLSVLRNEVMTPHREEEIWIDWWLSDTSTPQPPSGNSNFFFFFDEAFTAPLAVVIMIGTFWPL